MYQAKCSCGEKSNYFPSKQEAEEYIEKEQVYLVATKNNSGDLIDMKSHIFSIEEKVLV